MLGSALKKPPRTPLIPPKKPALCQTGYEDFEIAISEGIDFEIIGRVLV